MLDKLSAAPADYDLIITDYAMPLLSGGDVLKQARRDPPRHARDHHQRLCRQPVDRPQGRARSWSSPSPSPSTRCSAAIRQVVPADPIAAL